MRPVGKILLLTVTVSVTVGLCVFTYYYVKYSRLIEAKLSAGPFANTSMLFAAPRTLAVGDVATPQEIADELRHSGYSESHNNRMGYFTLKPDEIDIYPGPGFVLPARRRRDQVSRQQSLAGSFRLPTIRIAPSTRWSRS